MPNNCHVVPPDCAALLIAAGAPAQALHLHQHLTALATQNAPYAPIVWLSFPSQLDTAHKLNAVVLLLTNGTPNELIEWRAALQQLGLVYQVINGMHDEMLQNAHHALAQYAPYNNWRGLTKRSEIHARWLGPCERCADPACEHRLFSALLQNR